jgi:Cation efflux family
MPNDSMRTVLVALGSGLGVALAKVGVAVFTGSSAMAAEASHSLADTANYLFLFVAQRRSSRYLYQCLRQRRVPVLARVSSEDAVDAGGEVHRGCALPRGRGQLTQLGTWHRAGHGRDEIVTDDETGAWVLATLGGLAADDEHDARPAAAGPM